VRLLKCYATPFQIRIIQIPIKRYSTMFRKKQNVSEAASVSVLRPKGDDEASTHFGLLKNLISVTRSIVEIGFHKQNSITAFVLTDCTLLLSCFNVSFSTTHIV
jgi:hypothetical protein